MKNVDIEVLRLYYKWTFQHIACHRNLEGFSFGLGVQAQFKFSSQDPQLLARWTSLWNTQNHHSLLKTSCHPLFETKTHILKAREIFVRIKASSYDSCLPIFEMLLTFLHVRAFRKHYITLSFREQLRHCAGNCRDLCVSHFLFSPNCQGVFSHHSYPRIPGAHLMTWSTSNRGRQQTQAECAAAPCLCF